MEKMIITVESCKACLYCVEMCPKQAITLSKHINKSGYQTIAVDKAKCVLCGRCVTVCPDYVYEIVEGV